MADPRRCDDAEPGGEGSGGGMGPVSGDGRRGVVGDAPVESKSQTLKLYKALLGNEFVLMIVVFV